MSKTVYWSKIWDDFYSIAPRGFDRREVNGETIIEYFLGHCYGYWFDAGIAGAGQPFFSRWGFGASRNTRRMIRPLIQRVNTLNGFKTLWLTLLEYRGRNYNGKKWLS